MASNSTIEVIAKYLPSQDPSLPAMALQVTRLVDSYILWIGTTELPEEEVEKAPLQGNLARDWACAMNSATVLFRSPDSDSAFAMSQRLAKRFKKQIFLSIDIPLPIGQGPTMLIEAEKGIVSTLKELEGVN